MSGHPDRRAVLHGPAHGARGSPLRAAVTTSSTVTTSEEEFTVYNVAVHRGKRRWMLRKRYSAFNALRDALRKAEQQAAAAAGAGDGAAAFHHWLPQRQSCGHHPGLRCRLSRPGVFSPTLQNDS